MRKIISFMHISLDGFVAGPNGEMNWININQEIFDHVEKRIAETDAAIYGRKTYEMMEAYWPAAADKPGATKHDINHSKWYKTAHKIVLSKTLAGNNLPGTTIISDDLEKKIQIIRESEGSEILLFGSPAATHSLMEKRLIDGYWLFVNPVILGEGIPLFIATKEKVSLKRVGTTSFACGVVELNYEVGLH